MFLDFEEKIVNFVSMEIVYRNLSDIVVNAKNPRKGTKDAVAKLAVMGGDAEKRLHHQISWNECAVKIVSERYRKI